jgi:hypothetical protein
MIHDTLQFRHARKPPDLDRHDVLRRDEVTMLDEPATVAVIGSSHYVGVPSLDYYELCSCRPIEGSNVTEVPLETGVDRRVRLEGDDLTVETEIEGRPLASFPGPEGTSVAYRFAPEAYTTVDVDDGAIETYHTYPEFDLALFTRTVLETVPGETPDRRVPAHE